MVVVWELRTVQRYIGGERWWDCVVNRHPVVRVDANGLWGLVHSWGQGASCLYPLVVRVGAVDRFFDAVGRIGPVFDGVCGLRLKFGGSFRFSRIISIGVGVESKVALGIQWGMRDGKGEFTTFFRMRFSQEQMECLRDMAWVIADFERSLSQALDEDLKNHPLRRSMIGIEPLSC